MKIWLNLIIRASSKGFTLLELLLASMMTFFVVSATGYAVLVMTQQSMVSEVASDTQSNLNRAMDFIADEAKSASAIYTTAAAATAAATNFTLPSGATVVLGLNIAGVSQPVIYYVRPRQSTDVWLGPNIIYRWGPSIDGNGAYTNAGTPANWQYSALVDAIANTSYYTVGGNNIAYTGLNEQGQKKCPAGGSATATGWSAIPSTTPFGSTTGFFACVSNDGSQAEIHAYASLASELNKRGIADSTNANNRNTDKATYGVVSYVYPRSTSPIIVTSTTAAAISQPAQASLTATGCSSALSVTYVSSTNGTTTTTTSWTPSSVSTFQPLIYPASPNTNAALTISGMTFSNPSTTDNSVTFTNGACVVTAVLNTP